VTAEGRKVLVQDTGGRFATALFLPIYWLGVPPETVEGRRQNLQGFVTVVFYPRHVVETALADLDRKGVDILLYDRAFPEGEGPFYCTESQAKNTRTALLEGKHGQGLRRAVTFETAGREWELRFARHRSTSLPIDPGRRGWSCLTKTS